MEVTREHGGRRLLPEAGDAGDAVGAVADEGEPVRDRPGRDAEARHDTRLVAVAGAPAVAADDLLADHALREVLVGRADHHLLDAGSVAKARGPGREGIVRLELDHRPHDDAECGHGALGRVELRQQVSFDAVAGLVAGKELVSERLDHVVEAARDVGDARLAEERDERREDAAQRPHGPALGVVRRGDAVERPEQLVGAVDEVDLHIRERRTK